MPQVRRAHGGKERQVRQVHRLFKVPGVQDDPALFDQHPVPERGRRHARRAQDEKGRTRLFQLLALPQVRVRDLGPAQGQGRQGERVGGIITFLLCKGGLF